ncbi:MAG: hypothetical protein K9L61_05085 [Candidatus Omnitrophica bacterium]|nr:hypothetical protein [Candidatus Omnitrophota bacterium]
MKKFSYFILFIVSFSFLVIIPNLAAQENQVNKYVCKSNYNHGYFIGFQAGQKEKVKRQDSEPQKSYSSSVLQKEINRIKKEKANFNQKCFKEGYLWGYKDGYAGRPMKKMEYRW